MPRVGLTSLLEPTPLSLVLSVDVLSSVRLRRFSLSELMRRAAAEKMGGEAEVLGAPGSLPVE